MSLLPSLFKRKPPNGTQPPTPSVAEIEATLSRKPQWAIDLEQKLESVRTQLDRTSEVLQPLGPFRREIEGDMERLELAFSDLARFIATGRACPDCRETRRRMIEQLHAILQTVYESRLPRDIDPESYTTRADAYQAGRQYTVLALQHVLKKALESEDYRLPRAPAGAAL